MATGQPRTVFISTHEFSRFRFSSPIPAGMCLGCVGLSCPPGSTHRKGVGGSPGDDGRMKACGKRQRRGAPAGPAARRRQEEPLHRPCLPFTGRNKPTTRNSHTRHPLLSFQGGVETYRKPQWKAERAVSPAKRVKDPLLLQRGGILPELGEEDGWEGVSLESGVSQGLLHLIGRHQSGLGTRNAVLPLLTDVIIALSTYCLHVKYRNSCWQQLVLHSLGTHIKVPEVSLYLAFTL